MPPCPFQMASNDVISQKGMHARFQLAKEELEKNKNYVNTLQVQLQEAMAFCRSQSDNHLNKELQLTNEVIILYEAVSFL